MPADCRRRIASREKGRDTIEPALRPDLLQCFCSELFDALLTLGVIVRIVLHFLDRLFNPLLCKQPLMANDGIRRRQAVVRFPCAVPCCVAEAAQLTAACKGKTADSFAQRRLGTLIGLFAGPC